MSASYVRNLVRTWCGQTAAAVSVPFFDTVNQEQKPTDDRWFSVRFGADYHEGNFCEAAFLENGFIEVMVFARAGTGDIQAVVALEAIVPDLMSKVDPSNRLKLESYEPIREASDGSAESHYRVSSAINYLHQL